MLRNGAWAKQAGSGFAAIPPFDNARESTLRIAMIEQPPPDALRDGALEMIAAGNSLEAVASVFGVSLDELRAWAAQVSPARRSHEVHTAAGARPWLHFPGTVVYPTGSNWAIIAAVLIALVIVIPAAGWPLAFRPAPRPALIAASVSVAMILIAAAIQSIRAARANFFEMRPDAVARCNLAGCTVLPYADIIGLSAVLGKGFYYIRFLTSTGVSMIIRPSFSQLENDERLWAWLQAIPKPDGSSIRRPSDV
jgi:hypothetical protein